MSDHFPLLKLPLELRIEVYSYVLLVNETIILKPADYQSRKMKTKLELSLFLVCKTVRCESSCVFWEQNVFEISGNMDGYHSSGYPEPAGFIQHAVVKFDVRDASTNGLLAITKNVYAKDPEDERERNRNNYLTRHFYLLEYWRRKMERLDNNVAGMAHLYPRSLTLDFANCYCVQGCCRDQNIEIVVRHLLQDWVPGGKRFRLEPVYNRRLKKWIVPERPVQYDRNGSSIIPVQRVMVKGLAAAAEKALMPAQWDMTEALDAEVIEIDQDNI